MLSNFLKEAEDPNVIKNAHLISDASFLQSLPPPNVYHSFLIKLGLPNLRISIQHDPYFWNVPEGEKLILYILPGFLFCLFCVRGRTSIQIFFKEVHSQKRDALIIPLKILSGIPLLTQLAAY